MKRLVVVLVFVAALVSMPVTPVALPTDGITASSTPTLDPYEGPVTLLSQAGASGADMAGVAYMSRTLTGQQLAILNTYATPAAHNGTLDLSTHLIPGWTLYRVDMSLQSLTALPERAVVGVPSPDNSTNFAIRKYDTDTYYSQLAQGFYNRPHDGRLANYSLYYDSPIYDPSTYGTAYFVVRSAPSATNMTVPVAIDDNGGTSRWVTVSVTQSVTLSANTQYFTVIDGSALVEVSDYYPTIRWRAEPSTGSFDTYRYDTSPPPGWRGPLNGYEAYLRYVYTPWNTTSGSALTFSDPQRTALRGNSTPLSGSTWSFTSASNNITLLRFDSNLSVTVGHSMTLWYSRSVTTNTLWDVPTSGQAVTWNQTLTLSYPSIPTGTVSRFVNLTRMTDWTPTGLYLGTSTTDHDEYTLYGKTVVCATMGNGTWTMAYSAHNYVTAIDSAASVVMTGALGTTTHFRDAMSVPVTTGSSNLTVWRGGSVVSNPANESEADGTRAYSWVPTSWGVTQNGLYRIEVFWANGTEAGYRTRDVVVYYPTTLTATQSAIAAHTDSTFDIRVYYNDTFTPQGLTAPAAAVVYSFDGGPNTAMTDLSNGTWTATVSTAGKTSGAYTVSVYASGYALQNQTTDIDVQLTYDTQSLAVSWSNGNTVTYVDSTRLVVAYRSLNGTPVPDAVVNVTDGTTYWTLAWSVSSGTYNFTFDGDMDPPGLGAHALTINAWKAGYQARTAATSLTINTAPTGMTVSWQPANVTIYYTESLNLTVDYTYSGGDVPSSGAQVNVTIGTHFYVLTYTGTVWVATIPGGDLGPGTFTADISAWRHGYDHATNTTVGITVKPSPNMFWVVWEPSGPSMTYAETLNITVCYTYASEPVPGATVRLYLNGNRVYDLVLGGDKLWHLSLLGPVVGLGTWNATVLANSSGYDTGRDERVLTVTVDTCTLTPNWVSTSIYYTHQTQLNVTIRDSLGNALLGALVNASFNGANYTMTHVSHGLYRLMLSGSVGLGSYPIRVYLLQYGYVNSTTDVSLDVIDTPTTTTVSLIYTGHDGQQWATLYNDGGLLIRIYCEDVDANPLTSLTVTVTLNSSVYPTTNHGNGTYTFTAQATLFGIGTTMGSVQFTVYGYEDGNEPVSFSVLPVPTHITTSIPVPATMYLNQTIVISLQYIDNHTGLAIDAVSVSMVWDGAHTWEKTGVGTYNVTFSSQSLSLTQHAFSVTLTRTNYSTSVLSQTVLVRAVRTSLVAAASYSQYEYELIELAATYTDLDHGVAITGATVTATIGTQVYTLTHIGGGVYSHSLNLTITPGSGYQVQFSASAPGCSTNSTVSSLVVYAKTRVYITLVTFAPVQGQSVTVGAELRQNDTNTPVSQAVLEFWILAHLRNGTEVSAVLTATTNAQGYGSQAYTVPFEAVSVDITIYYAGQDSIWWAVYAVKSVTVLSQPSLLLLFQNPVIQLALISVFVTVVAQMAYNRRVKPKKIAALAKLKAQLKAFKDLGALRHFMAVYANRGTCVFYYPFGEQRIQPDLISGFISAVTSVYGEIKGDGVQGTLEEIQYQGLRVNSYSGKHIIGILILEGEMSPLLRERLQFFVELFESQFGNYLDDWTGLIDCFDPEWIVSTLNTTLNYKWHLPHRFGHVGKLKGLEGKVLEAVGKMLDERGEFLFSRVLEPLSDQLQRTQAELLNILVRLEESGAIVPISVQTVLQRQGLGLPGIAPTIQEETTGEAKEPMSSSQSTADEIGRVEPIAAAEPAKGVAPVEASHETLPPDAVTTRKEGRGKRSTRASKTDHIETPTPERPAEEVPAPEKPVPERPAEETTASAKPAEEKQVEEKPSSDADAFLRDVEVLLSKEADSAGPKSQTKPVDSAEEFVREVEDLLRKEPKKKKKGNRPE
ncbi:MAG: hypothetical protein HXY34_03465 [Candidatus Thorarchaeota archaeon]|nr:hypothetical protein [Candidatus Thorarchaeota archaeon]